MKNLQYIKKPSKRRQAEDSMMAGSIAKDNKFGEYDPNFNPYKDGVRRDRFERYYKKVCHNYWEYEPIFRDLCEVYGYIPEK